MYCKNCETPLPDDANYCLKCGEHQSPCQKKQRDYSERLHWVAVIAFILAAVTFAIVLMLVWWGPCRLLVYYIPATLVFAAVGVIAQEWARKRLCVNYKEGTQDYDMSKM